MSKQRHVKGDIPQSDPIPGLQPCRRLYGLAVQEGAIEAAFVGQGDRAADKPRIQAGYLSDPADVRALAHGVEMARESIDAGRALAKVEALVALTNA
mgnify:CR=1 FL=1